MTDLAGTAEAFVAMAHRIVWATVATVDPAGRPRSRILHPLWSWDGEVLSGIVATGPTPVKQAALEHTPYVSVGYWSPEHDTCSADCRAEWVTDDAGRQAVWSAFVEAPAPVGYDPAMVPVWGDGPLSPAFAGLRLEPFRLRVFPGTVLLGTGGEVLSWRA